MAVNFDAGKFSLLNSRRDGVGGNYGRQYSGLRAGIDETLNTEVIDKKYARDPRTGEYIAVEGNGIPSTSLLGRLGAWIWSRFAGDRQEVAPRVPGNTGSTVPAGGETEGSLVPGGTVT
jgi:hypothetical protein